MKKLFPADTVTTDEIRERMADIAIDHDDESDPRTWPTPDRGEYLGLQSILADIGDDASLRDPVTLINDDYFTAHVRSEWLEIGPELYEWDPEARQHVMITREDLLDRWPFSEIDWSAAASDERRHYKEIEIDRCMYLYTAP